jgi:hypothetical protein
MGIELGSSDTLLTLSPVPVFNFITLGLSFLFLTPKGLLAPHQVSAKSENMDNILVTWQPPKKADSAVREYIVEWRALQPGSITKFPPHWLRIPPDNMSALISGASLLPFLLEGHQGPLYLCAS